MIVVTALHGEKDAVRVKYFGSVEINRQQDLLFIKAIVKMIDNGRAIEMISSDFFMMEDIISIRGE